MAEPQEQERTRRRFISERGRFEICANPTITTPSARGTCQQFGDLRTRRILHSDHDDAR